MRHNVRHCPKRFHVETQLVAGQLYYTQNGCFASTDGRLLKCFDGTAPRAKLAYIPPRSEDQPLGNGLPLFAPFASRACVAPARSAPDCVVESGRRLIP